MSLIKPSVSIVLPCYHEQESLPRCIEALDAYAATKPAGWLEVVFVDDGSRDGTWDLLERAVSGREGWRAVRFLRNSGSHIAIRCGYRYTHGERVVNLPVDLQDPVENIDLLLERMNETNADAVLAVRKERGDSRIDRFMSRMYNRALHLSGLKNIPLEGTSQFLLTRRVVQMINSYSDHGFNLDGFIATAPIKIEIVWYHRLEAVGRVSRWTLERKIQHAINTIVTFSNVPIRTLSLTGVVTALLGLCYALFVVLWAIFAPVRVSGWASLMCAVLLLGGLNLLALGLLGEYAWRILDEARRKPLYQVEETVEAISEPSEEAGVRELSGGA
jgi:polyisoprenyl-phosphate glycosyltransferase